MKKLKKTAMLMLALCAVALPMATMAQEAVAPEPAISLELFTVNNTWMIYDLGSANGKEGTNGEVTEKGRLRSDGDIIAFGATLALFRGG